MSISHLRLCAGFGVKHWYWLVKPQFKIWTHFCYPLGSFQDQSDTICENQVANQVVWFLFLSTKYPSILIYNILPLLFIDVIKGSLVELFNKVLLKLQLFEDVLKKNLFVNCLIISFLLYPLAGPKCPQNIKFTPWVESGKW